MLGVGRIPEASHKALGRIRDYHLRVTRQVLRGLRHHGDDVDDFACH